MCDAETQHGLEARFCCSAGRSWANARCRIGSGAVWGNESCAKAENLRNSRPLICISELQPPRPSTRNVPKTQFGHSKCRTNARERRSMSPKLHHDCAPLTSSHSLPPHAQGLARGATWYASRSLRRGNRMIRNGRTSLPGVGLMRRRGPARLGNQFFLLAGPVLGQRAVQNMCRGCLGSEPCAKSREPLELSTPHMH